MKLNYSPIIIVLLLLTAFYACQKPQHNILENQNPIIGRWKHPKSKSTIRFTATHFIGMMPNGYRAKEEWSLDTTSRPYPIIQIGDSEFYSFLVIAEDSLKSRIRHSNRFRFIYQENEDYYIKVKKKKAKN